MGRGRAERERRAAPARRPSDCRAREFCEGRAMTEAPLATRTFTFADQLRFAGLSGDANPMHVDPVAARRTQYGQPVVHGVHGLLWGLDAAAAGGVDLSAYRGLVAQFLKPILLDEEVEVRIAPTGADLTLDLRVGSLVATRVRLTREPPEGADASASLDAPAAARLEAPRARAFEDMEGAAGAFDYAASELADAFPAAARALGLGALEGIAASTYVVGMDCPGLHSIFSQLTARLEPGASGGRVAFATASVDPRFRLVELVVRSPAIEARVRAFARMPPVDPPTMREIAGVVRPDEFAGQRALVVGGSRGLGAATAKIVAAGGGDVTISYARGAAEAAGVVDDIASAGGRCAAIAYDVLSPPEAQLDQTPFASNAVYYFATSTIWRRKVRAFEPALLAEFMRFHVDGFARLAETVRARTEGPLALFYPSSSYAAEIPKDFGEYAAAKRAGEAIAENLAAALRRVSVIVERLPPVSTDQNASLTAARTISPVEAMLPVVRRMQLAL
jgi:acyl dehydratase/NAD(P)-dependent dehydrogenase (short-subunit alcohol dehydrogenase family)